MSKFKYEISDDLTDEERRIVTAKRDVCWKACPGVSLRWTVTLDHKNRRFLRLTDYTRLDKCYFEATPQDIEGMSDSRFEIAIINKERTCSNDSHH